MERIVSSVTGAGKTEQPYAEEWNWNITLYHTQKSTQNGSKALNIRPETIKLLEENIGSKLLDTGLGNNFLDLTQRAKATKANKNKWDYIKLKSSCTTKETINQMKRQSTEWKKIFANHISYKGLIPEI